MMNFRGVFEQALLGPEHEPVEDPAQLDEAEGARFNALRAALCDVQWPASCPWIGTDAWLMRQMERVKVLEVDGPWRDERGEPVAPLCEEHFVRMCLDWRDSQAWWSAVRASAL